MRRLHSTKSITRTFAGDWFWIRMIPAIRASTNTVSHRRAEEQRGFLLGFSTVSTQA